MRARAIRSRPVIAISIVLVVLVCCAAEGWGGSGLLCVLPALLLGCVLFARRYPGERVLLRWARSRGDSRRRATPLRAAPRRAVVCMPRGARLMGSALAVRPPPRPLAAS